MGTTSRCCGHTSGGRRRTRAATCCRTCTTGSRCSTSAAGRRRSPPIWRGCRLGGRLRPVGRGHRAGPGPAPRPRPAGGRPVRAGRRRRPLRRRPRPPGAPAPRRPGGGAAGDGGADGGRRAGGGAGLGLPGLRVDRRRRAPRPVARRLPPGDPAQRRQRRRRPPPAALGPGGGAGRRHLLDVDVDLRHARGAGVVVGPVGHPDGAVRPRHPGRGLRHRHRSASWRRSPRAGTPGLRTPTPCSSSSTANCWRAPEAARSLWSGRAHGEHEELDLGVEELVPSTAR